MPANLPPQYFDVEKKYREAKDLQEKLVYLQQLLSIIPKHKGTEKLQAELKTKISKLKDSIGKQKKSKGSGGAWYQVEKQGAGQVVFLGLPNSGKSSLLNTLTNAHAEIGLYPFTTQLPQIGMMDFENTKIQIVDTPPLYDDAPPWLFGLYRNGDVLLIVLDINKDIHKDFEMIRNSINDKNIFVTQHEFGDIKKVIIVLNKADSQEKSPVKDTFIEKYKKDFLIISVSTKDSKSIDTLKRKIFQELNIIRVYTKKIGKPIVKNDPVVLQKGTTVIDAAEHIHKDFKKQLKFARLWNESGHSGQRVEKNHILVDEDVLEFHV
ncbi:TGS domain-containing protein [candidate division WOR-3 bacterium]|nr:TGS domain-containing protein [candidate division WOR-3 bacterium]